MGLQPQRLSLFSESRESMIPVIFILESLKQQIQKKILKNFEIDAIKPFADALIYWTDENHFCSILITKGKHIKKNEIP